MFIFFYFLVLKYWSLSCDDGLDSGDGVNEVHDVLHVHEVSTFITPCATCIVYCYFILRNSLSVLSYHHVSWFKIHYKKAFNALGSGSSAWTAPWLGASGRRVHRRSYGVRFGALVTTTHSERTLQFQQLMDKYVAVKAEVAAVKAKEVVSLVSVTPAFEKEAAGGREKLLTGYESLLFEEILPSVHTVGGHRRTIFAGSYKVDRSLSSWLRFPPQPYIY